MTPRTLRLSDGATVRAIEAGAGAPLVLLHGVGLRAEAWAPQIEALKGGAHVIAADLPGHGDSDPLPARPRLEDYVDWAARLVEALGAGPVSVAGHSMGALIALGLAIERPDLVRRAALLNVVHRRSPEARQAVRARAAELAEGAADIEAPLDRWFGAGQEDLRQTVAAWLRRADRAGYAAAYRAFAEGDSVYAGRVGEVRCPLLVLTGDGDPNSTAEMTRAMGGMAPSGRAVVIAGHRHMVNLTAPGQVSAELAAWLATEEIAA
jgi:pimeloyl-ACP methyl ester carboxylesterase